jgi:hypothetical protein
VFSLKQADLPLGQRGADFVNMWTSANIHLNGIIDDDTADARPISQASGGGLSAEPLPVAIRPIWSCSFDGNVTELILMEKRFKVGDHVTWNSEVGHVSGKIIRVHIKDVDYKGHMHRASKNEPQYEIKSDKTDHIAMHTGTALNKMND